MARGLLTALVLAVALGAAGCGSGGGASSAKAHFSLQDVKSAYFKPKDSQAVESVTGFWQNPDDHAHTNYVPLGGIEACPLAQRADISTKAIHTVEPKAGEPTGLYVVQPTNLDDQFTPTITQGALVFGTGPIADNGMEQVSAAIDRCPTSYVVRGGPPQILGNYQVTKRPLEIDGWKGYAQQLAHTSEQDDVYYQDFSHLVLHRANVIYYLDVDHKKVIGDRSDSGDQAELVAKTVLQRLDSLR